MIIEKSEEEDEEAWVVPSSFIRRDDYEHSLDAF